jgi:hypothetical protein
MSPQMLDIIFTHVSGLSEVKNLTDLLEPKLAAGILGLVCLRATNGSKRSF